MTGIVSGNSLGLELTSLATLQQRGQIGTAAQGQAREQTYVNVANGNLVLRDLEDRLESTGLDVEAVRTYNSQGLLNDDNGDNWSTGFYKQQLTYTGTLNAAGSTVTRTAQDGSQAVYAYDATAASATFGKYVTTMGSGAYDTIAYTNNVFVWTDGATGAGETYTKTVTGEARLTSATDNQGSTIAYEYDASGLISKLTGASGEAILYTYSTGKLQSVKYVSATGVQTSHVTYTYDNKNRLTGVSVDLTPANTTDNLFFKTTYGYDGQSMRVASITQGDGVVQKFTYASVGGVYRVASVQDGVGKTTTYSYDTANRKTTVTDPLGRATVYEYDTAGQLVKVTEPAVNGASSIVQYAYDAAGNLVQVTDSQQAANNRTFVNDAAGKVLYVNQGGHVQRQTIVNGDVLGRYGEAVNDLEARNAGVPQFKTVADFAFAFKSAGGDTPNLPDMQHTVGAGDTMEALAQSYYGDSRLWYRIAEANGLSSNEDLRAGQVLKIPGTERNGNASNTFRPYQPGEIVGDTMPYVPLPTPKKSSFFGQLLAIVAAVVVAYVTQQWYLLEYGLADAGAACTASAATTEGSIGAAIGGAAGSVASQAVSIAAGNQRSFNWKQVGLSAVSGGVSQGMPTGDLLGTTAGTLPNALVHGAMSGVVSQGIGVALGLQHSFSWKNVAASAVGAGVGQSVGGSLGMNDPGFKDLPFGEQFGPRLVTGLAASTGAALARGGRVAIQQAPTDAFGNALGGSLVYGASSAGETQASVTLPSSGAYSNLNLDQAREYGFVVSDSDFPFDGPTADASSVLKLTAAGRGSADAIARQRAAADTQARMAELQRNIDDLTALGLSDSGATRGTDLRVSSSFGFGAQLTARGLIPSDNAIDNFARGFSGNGSVLDLDGSTSTTSYALGNAVRGGLGLVYDGLTGAGDFREAGQAWRRGEYASASMYGMRGAGTVGLTAVTLGDYALAKASLAGMTSNTGLKVSAETLEGLAYSPLAPGGGLAAHEAAGGHLLLKHVGKTESQLLNRLAADPGISGSSSFFDRAAAEAGVSRLLDAKQPEIANWLASSSDRLRLVHAGPDPVGISVLRGATGAVDASSTRAILVRDPSMPTGYKVLTGYPTR